MSLKQETDRGDCVELYYRGKGEITLGLSKSSGHMLYLSTKNLTENDA